MIEWERPDWQASSKCRGSRPALFYPEKGEGEDATAVAQAAKSVCNGQDGHPPCSVKAECLEYALENHEKFGVWGGRTERERTSLKRMRRKVASPMGRVIRTVKKSALRQLLDTSKTETRILGAIRRHLMVRPSDDRATDVIHPSDMSKSEWCPRADYLRITDAPAAEAELTPFTMENVWAEGHDIHSKWQTWLWEMGLLRGEWLCYACGEQWFATAPLACPAGHGRECITYLEVPLYSDRYLISGHADGDIADDEDDELCPLIEIKSIGMGTIRYDAPHLLSKYTCKVKEDNGSEHSVFDMESLWRDLKRPFASHVKQGMLYLHLSGRREIIFIYENKFNQQVKEFRVRYNEELIADLLDACLDIKYALETGQPPRRPHWATHIENSTCAKCVYQDTCWGAYLENDDEEPGSRNGSQSNGSAGSGRTRRVVLAGSSGLRNTEAAAQNH